MAIQIRRGLLKDFDATKMLPGEWAVCTDSSRRNQQIFMCIAPGNVKRMGTYEDFEDMIADATDSIKQQYIDAFNEIKTEIESDKDHVHTEYTYTVNFKSQLDNTYLPSIQASQEAAAESELNAAESEAGASTSAVNAADAEQKAKDYAAAAKTAADSIVGALKPKGTITFALLPTTEIAEGDMYNISDEFTSDNRFKDGGDIQYPAGTNVYCTSDGMWDCLAGDMAGYVMEVDFDETLENSMPTYPAAEELAEPVAGEKFSVFLGKVKKAITSLMSTITTLTNYITATNETLAQLNSDLNKKPTKIFKSIDSSTDMTIQNLPALCIWTKSLYGQSIVGLYDDKSNEFVCILNNANQTITVTKNSDGTITLKASAASYATRTAIYLN